MQISKQYILHDKSEASHLLNITINSLKSAFRPRPPELRVQGQNIPKLSMDRMDRMDTLAAKLANAPGSNILTKVKHSTTAMAGFSEFCARSGFFKVLQGGKFRV